MLPTSSTLVRVVLLVLLFGTATLALAQQPGSPMPPGPPPVKDPKLDTLERQNREATLRSAEMAVTVERIDEKRIAAALERMKEDFRRLQIVRNQVAHSVLSNQPFNYKAVSAETGEIGKRAERLKSFLILKPGPQEKERSPLPEIDLSEQQMKNGLARLCHLIDSFVDSPALRNSGTVEAQQAAKMGQDLIAIVKLSEVLRKNAERLAGASK
jgi:hypothetical protein